MTSPAHPENANSTSAEARFLAGGGDVGALMRAHDWSNSPLGPPETWPQSLRSVVGLLLSSKFPMFVAWGDELGFLYNDAYVEILGGKHPRALGRRFYDIWSEIWPDISPLIDASLAGQATYRENLPLLMNRNGFDEQTTFTFSYSPVRDESGKVAGMFCACTETTKQITAETTLRESEERQAFLLDLGDRMRAVESPADVLAIATRALGERLNASRVVYVEIDDEAGLARIREGWTAAGATAHPAELRLSDFAGPLLETLRSGATVRLNDVGDIQTRSDLTALDAIEVRAIVSVPLIVNGRFVLNLNVQQDRPRQWMDAEVELIYAVAERTWAAVERARTEEQLRLREAELARVQRIGRVGGVHIEPGPAGLIGHRSPEYLQLHGLSADASSETHEDWLRRVHPVDRERADSTFQVALASSEGSYESEYRIVRPIDGAVRWISAKADIERDAEGRLLRMIGAHIDITERKHAEQQLTETAARLRHIVDSAVEYAIITLDAEGGITSWNTGAERLLGYGEREIVGRSGEIFFTPEDRAAGEAKREMRQARETGRAANERWHLRKDGSRFWGSGVMLKLQDGAPDMLLKIFRDQTEERRADERQQVLINELNHRVKNTLATVQAIASQTLRGSKVERQIRDTFEARLTALAAGHDVLTQESWERADLRQVVASALKPFKPLHDGRLIVDGPSLYVAPKPALSLIMALHELATNAAKYGALSNEDGRVRINWTVDNDRLRLLWAESDGPAVKAPSRKGFGSRLIERSLASDLDAEVGIEFAPRGVVCTVEAPVKALRGISPTVESMLGGGLYE